MAVLIQRSALNVAWMAFLHTFPKRSLSLPCVGRSRGAAHSENHGGRLLVTIRRSRAVSLFLRGIEVMDVTSWPGLVRGRTFLELQGTLWAGIGYTGFLRLAESKRQSVITCAVYPNRRNHFAIAGRTGARWVLLSKRNYK